MLCFCVSATYTESLKCSCNIPSELRFVLSLLCPCAGRYNPLTLIFVGFILFPSHLHRVSALSRLPVISATSQKCLKQSLCAFDALEAAEVPAFLQTCSDTGQLLSEGAGQPRKKRLHLAGVNLQTRKSTVRRRSFLLVEDPEDGHWIISTVSVFSICLKTTLSFSSPAAHLLCLSYKTLTGCMLHRLTK